MIKSPIVKVSIASTGRDISESISSFDYEQCVNKDDLYKLRFDSDASVFVDDPDIVAKAKLNVQFGYIKGIISSVHEITISEIEATYDKKAATLNLSCFDKGQNMKKFSSNMVWANVKASDIAQVMAYKYNLAFIGQESSRIYKSYPQAGKTDFELLSYMAARETGGDWLFYVTNNELHFEPVDYGKNPGYLFTLGIDIIKVGFKYKSSRRDNTSLTNTNDDKSKTGVTAADKNFLGIKMNVYIDQDLTAIYDTKNQVYIKPANTNNLTSYKETSLVNVNSFQVNPVTGVSYVEPVTKVPLNGGRVNGGKLMDDVLQHRLDTLVKPEVEGPTGLPVYDIARSTPDEPVLRLMPGNEAEIKAYAIAHGFGVPDAKEQTKAIMQNLVNALKKPKVLTMSLDVQGNPLIEVGNLITIKGVSKKFEGNWYVESTKNSIAKGKTYITNLECIRNATHKAIIAEAPALKPGVVNKKTADGDNKKVKEVPNYFFKKGNQVSLSELLKP